MCLRGQYTNKMLHKEQKKVREVSIEVLIKKMQNHKIHDTFLTAHLLRRRSWVRISGR